MPYEGSDVSFELIGLLAIFDPPRSDTKQTIDDVLALGVKVKMVTGDQLAITKETGCRLGLGDHMYSAKVLKDGPTPGGKHASLDEMIMDADGFAGVFPSTSDGANNAPALSCANDGIPIEGATDAARPALSRANNGIPIEGATDAARGAADIVLTEPDLSTIVHAIRSSRIISPAIFAFAYKFDFPPFMILIFALLNDGTIMTLSVDRVLPSNTPDSWDLAEIFSYAVAYELYTTLSSVVFVIIIFETSLFQDKFGVSLDSFLVQHNDASQILVGIGTGMRLQNALRAIQIEFKDTPRFIGQATGLASFAQLMGSTPGLGIAERVFASELGKAYAPAPPLPSYGVVEKSLCIVPVAGLALLSSQFIQNIRIVKTSARQMTCALDVNVLTG
ncbi:hypothetical protein K438DRAFT_2025141 [Mycena galopus ATCC 62051]|nr:hypothetical protein K438DRAFT_2025141 [Mycena galopus ATCC 62051]